MGKKVPEQNDIAAEVRIENLNYIKDNISLLSHRDKISVLNIIALDIDSDQFVDCADGCRIVINDISDESIEAIIKVISYQM